MGKVIQLPVANAERGTIGGRDYLAREIENEKTYRESRARAGIKHQRDVAIPLELAEVILAILDEHGIR